MMKCSQCYAEITDSLASTITSQQVKIAKDPENECLLCIACFCSNGMMFECPEELRTAPLAKELIAIRNEEKEKARAEKRVERKRKVITNKGNISIPNGDDRTVARWDISKNGRLGKPMGVKNDEGHNCWACPICDKPCDRKYNFPGRSLDDVVHHMLEDGCYARFLAEETA